MTDKRNRILAAIVSSYAYIVDHNNFGSLFQYYALQQYLKSLGVTAYWIRYVFPHLARYKSLFKKFVQALFHGYDVIFFLHYLRTQATFRSYIRTYCNVSKRKYDSIIELKRNVPVADIYITGSDQAWGGCLEPNYLTFVPRGKRKIAYAVSFGTRNITPEHAANIRNWVEDFDFVSVRESSGVEICRNLGVKARHLLDPTLLIDDNDYIHVLDINNFIKEYETYNSKNIGGWSGNSSVTKVKSDEPVCYYIDAPLSGDSDNDSFDVFVHAYLQEMSIVKHYDYGDFTQYFNLIGNPVVWHADKQAFEYVNKGHDVYGNYAFQTFPEWLFENAPI